MKLCVISTVSEIWTHKQYVYKRPCIDLGFQSTGVVTLTCTEWFSLKTKTILFYNSFIYTVESLHLLKMSNSGLLFMEVFAVKK